VKEEKLESTGNPELDKQLRAERDQRQGGARPEQRRRDEPDWVRQEVGEDDMIDFGSLQTKESLTRAQSDGGDGGMPSWASGGDLEADRQRWLRGDRPTVDTVTPAKQAHTPTPAPGRAREERQAADKRAEGWGEKDGGTPVSRAEGGAGGAWQDAAPRLSSAITAGSLFSPGLSMFGQFAATSKDRVSNTHFGAPKLAIADDGWGSSPAVTPL
jgi:hypothetical protein